MKRTILLAVMVVLVAMASSVLAAEVFRAEVTKDTFSCGDDELVEGPSQDIFIRFDSPMWLTWSGDENFEFSETLQMLRYVQSADRRVDFIAIQSQGFSPEEGKTVLGFGFVSMYGKVKLDANLSLLSVKGKIFQMFGTVNGDECLNFMRFKTVERLADVVSSTPPTSSTPVELTIQDIIGTWRGTSTETWRACPDPTHNGTYSFTTRILIAPPRFSIDEADAILTIESGPDFAVQYVMAVDSFKKNVIGATIEDGRGAIVSGGKFVATLDQGTMSFTYDWQTSSFLSPDCLIEGEGTLTK